MESDQRHAIHTRTVLVAGPEHLDSPNAVSAAREKLFQVIEDYGWEHTMVALAGCARLYAEVPAPCDDLTPASNKALHDLALVVYSYGVTSLRALDREVIRDGYED